MLRYKGYTTTLQLDPDSRLWYGRVLDIQDVVTFEGRTKMEAEKEFRRAIETYLNFCQTLERLPSQPPFSHRSNAANSPAESLRGQDDNFGFSM
jgi:predicted HicB family RNase H-like nuclease